MVTSIQPIQHSTANLNKIGFGNENLEAAQPQVSLEEPKDTFVPKKSHAVRNGAITGVIAGLIPPFIIQPVLYAKDLNIPFKDSFTVYLENTSIPRLSAYLVGVAAIGAGFGAIVKHFTKKD